MFVRPFVHPFVRLLPAFLEIGSLVFADFWHKDAKWQCPFPSISEKKSISGRKCRKYTGKPGFLAFSRDFIIRFFWFSPQRCALVMFKTWPSPTIKHGSIVNKTDFCSRNSLKIAGTADIRRKNSISWISQAVLYIFSWNFSQRCILAILKTWLSPIWHFLNFSSCTLYFFIKFCTLIRNGNARKVMEPDFF